MKFRQVKSTRLEPARIRAVKTRGGFKLHLTFVDGIEKDVDLEPLLHGEIFEAIRNVPELFRAVHFDPVSETLTWANGADTDADVLRYDDLVPAWMEDASLKKNARKNNEHKQTSQPLVSKHVYLYPRQVKLFSKIDSNLSAAIRQVVDAYPKLKE